MSGESPGKDRQHEILFIVLRAANGCIASGGKVPWAISADLKRFKKLTLGKPMVMGRKTFESLPGLLPGRRHIVLTRDPDWNAEGAEVAHDVQGALALVGTSDFAVIGGAEIFALMADHATLWEITQVNAVAEGEVFLDLPGDDWVVTAQEDHAAAGGDPAYSFMSYRRCADRESSPACA